MDDEQKPEVDNTRIEQTVDQDDLLDEDTALDQATDEGYEFEDYWTVLDDKYRDTQFESREDALEAAGGDEAKVTQHRNRKV